MEINIYFPKDSEDVLNLHILSKEQDYTTYSTTERQFEITEPEPQAPEAEPDPDTPEEEEPETPEKAPKEEREREETQKPKKPFPVGSPEALEACRRVRDAEKELKSTLVEPSGKRRGRPKKGE